MQYCSSHTFMIHQPYTGKFSAINSNVLNQPTIIACIVNYLAY